MGKKKVLNKTRRGIKKTLSVSLEKRSFIFHLEGSTCMRAASWWKLFFSLCYEDYYFFLFTYVWQRLIAVKHLLFVLSIFALSANPFSQITGWALALRYCRLVLVQWEKYIVKPFLIWLLKGSESQLIILWKKVMIIQKLATSLSVQDVLLFTINFDSIKN